MSGPCDGGCGCGPRETDRAAGPSRREVIAAAGAGAMAMGAVVAGPFAGGEAGHFTADPDHFVPADKRLSPGWLRALVARGEPEVWSGADLRCIGMPAGGLCAGQVYLTGDGRLTGWDVVGQHVHSGYGRLNYQAGREPERRVVAAGRWALAPEVAQGAALRVRVGARDETLRLDASGHAEVSFRGEWPLATVRFADPRSPVAVELEAGSPFLPLDADDSGLPATLLGYTLTNRSDETVEVTLAGWLDNFSCLHTEAERWVGRVRRRNRVHRDDVVAAIVGTAEFDAGPPAAGPRPPLRFADFEGGDHGAWQVEGEAFGAGPAHGTLPRQQEVSGFEGEGLVNSFLHGDGSQGRLRSPEFVVEHAFISFLIGGGSHAGRTCLNLVDADGTVLRTASGHDIERLEERSWDVRDLRGRRLRLEIVDRASGPWGHVNVDRIEFRDTPPPAASEDLRAAWDHGSVCLAVVEVASGDAAVELLGAGDFDADEPAASIAALRPLADEAEPTERSGRRRPVAALAARLQLTPGASATITFAVCWHFPELHTLGRRVGRRYAARFSDALAVAQYLSGDLERLRGATRAWRDTYYDSTLPHWLLDRLHSTVANLATSTCQWWQDGRFWGWEGVGCCAGTCGHVWNYAQAPARLFPALERSVRELQDFGPGVGFDAATGRIGFRGENWKHWAADAQCGYVLKAWREHLCSEDDGFLRGLWDRVRLALQFLIDRDAEGDASHGEQPDGVLEGRQHNTYDIDYFGVNPLSGWLYVAALRAGARMAAVTGDAGFGARCDELAKAGRERLLRESFDAQRGYFVQRVDAAEHPDWQMGVGCLADQLFGQSLARQLDLDDVVPADIEGRTLDSIWRYCWAPDVGPQNRAHPPERWFARPGEAGLFTCTWPHDRHLGPRSTRYRDEVWTGIEYQVAANLAWAGRVTEALAMCRAVHERYHPARRNPFNEVECGDHYARSMASWSVLLGLSGFHHDGPAGELGFAPRITPEDFRCAFTTAAGWGSFAQRRDGAVQTATIELRGGRLRLRELRLELAPGTGRVSAELSVDGQLQEVEIVQDGAALRLRTAAALLLTAPTSLAVTLRA